MATLYRRVAALTVALLLALGPTWAAGVLAVDPIAETDTYFVNEDQVLTVAAPGVLGNDELNGGTGCVVGYDASYGLDGSLGSGVAADGSFTFTPTANSNGASQFSYVLGLVNGTACDPTGQQAAVDIHVAAVNDPPTVALAGGCSSGNVAVQEDSGAYDNACVSFSPGPGNESTQSLAEWIVGAESTIGFSSGPTIADNGDLQFTPNANECGTANLSVAARDDGGTANDGVDTSTAVAFSITVACVNDAPTAAADSFIALKDRTLNVAAPGVLVNDDDIDNASLSAVKVSNPSHGVVTLAADGSFSYTPTAGYAGPDAFSYKAFDGAASSPNRVVSFTVTAVPTPIPTLLPTPVPTAVPTTIPTPAETIEPSPSAEASASPEPSLGPGETAAPTNVATPAPSSSPAPVDEDGGVSLPVLLVIVLFVLLVGFGAALYAPKWLAAQRGGPRDQE